MAMQSRTARAIVDARADKDGKTTHVKLEGNSIFIPVSRAIPMADRGEIANTHVVRPAELEPYLRTNRDGDLANNIDTLSEK